MSQVKSEGLEVVRNSRLISRVPLFYGWVILGVGSLGLIMTSPGQTYAVSVFIEHFISELGISRSLVSTLYTVGTLVGSFALPVVGRQIDRRGPRVMVGAIAALFGLGCIYMGFVANALMLGLGFVAIRMLGQGSLSLVSQNVINQWWVRRRGMAMGVSGLLMSLVGLGGFPSLINWLIPLYGWRVTYMILGLLLLVVMVPMGLLLVRNQPESYGLRPDGSRLIPQHPLAATVEPAEENWTLAESLRTVPFWVFSISLALIAMLSTGLFFHMVSIFSDNGLAPGIAASVFVPIAITNAVVNLASGVLVDWIPVRILLAVALFFMALSLLLAQYLQGVELAFIYGVILGTTTGLMGTVNGVSWAMYFGRRHLGSITGIATTVLIAGSALGPMPMGIARDILGNYNTALSSAAFLPLLLALVSLFVGKPQKRPQEPGA